MSHLPSFDDAATMPQGPAKLDAFAALVVALAASAKRLDKAHKVCAYVATLGDDDLVLASRYLAATPFAAWDGRRLGMGPAAIIDVICALTDTQPDRLKALSVKLGDLAWAVAEVVGPTRQTTAPLRLKDVADLFDVLASTSGPAHKKAALKAVLTRACGLEARVIVGIVQRELRCGLREGALEDALARAFGATVASVQRCNMLVGDIGQTAVMARHQTLDEARLHMFAPLRFMLATPVENAKPTVAMLPRPFIAEDKYDGIRCQVHLAIAEPSLKDAKGVIDNTHEPPVRVALFSRTLDEITQSFWEMVPSLAQWLRQDGAPKQLIIDGELLAVDGESILPFSQLQPRLGRKHPTQAFVNAHPVVLMAFDCLHADDTLLDAPLAKRRKVMHTLAQHLDPQASLTTPRAQSMRLCPQPMLDSLESLDRAFLEARARGNEGLVIKHPNSPYTPGRRGREWLKVKRPHATLDVVVTSVEVGSGRRRLWLSDYTFAVRADDDDPSLLTIGKAYSGLTDVELETMTKHFMATTTTTLAHGRVRLVAPQVVIEVAFDKVMVSPRHKSGYALRFPRIIRLRPDKKVDDIDTLKTVAAMVLSNGSTA